MLTWFANRRRADVVQDGCIAWTLASLFGLRLSLVVMTKGDDEFDERPVSATQAFVVLKGHGVLNEHKWLQPGTVRLTRKDTPQSIKLFAARTYEEALFDLNGWMEGNEIVHDSQRRLWLLVVTG